MTSNTITGLTIPRLLYLVILFSLIFGFYKELAVTGIKLYTNVIKDPRAEQLLGDYYRTNSRLNGQLSYQFYSSALKNYQNSIPGLVITRKALVNLRIGQLYECGKGVVQNLSQAKHWYQAALAASDRALETKQQNKQTLGTIMGSLSRVEQAIEENTFVICPPVINILTSE